MARPNVRKCLIDAAKALELAVEGMGPNPINPIFSNFTRCEPSGEYEIPIPPTLSRKPPCGPLKNLRLLKVFPINPTLGQIPPCRPTPPWIKELQVTLLETASWCRYLAEERKPPSVKVPPRRRPRPKSRPKLARRKTRR